MKLGVKLESEAKQVRDGVTARAELEKATQSGKSIESHITEFEKSLSLDTGTTPEYIQKVCNRARRSLATFQTLTDLHNTEAIRKALAKLRDDKKKGFGLATYNHYVAAVRTFGEWLVKNNRIGVSPFTNIEKVNAQTDVRRKRRALTSKEFKRLIAATEKNPKSVQCYTGPERALIYKFAYYTGLRKSEIASLTPESFKAKQITIEATISKHRREDVIPTHKALLAAIKPHLKTIKAGEPLFPKQGKRDAAKMMKADLKAAGIPYKTDEGYADFHAGRHTFITRLLGSGVSVVDTMALARHSDVKMTMKYSHIEKERQAAAIAKLSY